MTTESQSEPVEESAATTDESRLTTSGLQTFGIKLIAVALGFISQLLLANLLGEAGYGQLAFALVTFQFLLLMAVWGTDTVSTRFMSEYRTQTDQRNTFSHWAHQMVLRHSLILMISGLAILCLMMFVNGRAIWFATALILLGLPLQALAMLKQGMLRGFQRPVLSALPDGILRPFFMIKFALAVFYLQIMLGEDFRSYHATGIYAWVSLITLIASQIFLMWCPSRRGPKLAMDQSDHSLWRSMATASMFSGVAMTIHSQSDVWMLGVMTRDELVGPYSAAVRYATFVVFGINAVNTVFAPMIANSMKDKQQLQKLASRAALISFAIGSAVSLPILIAPEFFLSWFGKEFSSASLPLRLLVAANLFNVSCGSVGMLLSMGGHHKLFMRILLCSMVLNLLLNLILIPLFQTLGAAGATTLSVVFWNVVGLYFVRKRMQIRPAVGGLV